MTRKDYELIALAFSNVLEDHQKAGRAAQCNGILDTAVVLSRRLAADNPRFDRVKFLRACGMSEASLTIYG